MTASDKTVYRVKQVVSGQVAIICEVKDGETTGGKVRETRDSKIVLGGEDSFWLVSGEKKEQKSVLQKQDAPRSGFAPGISPMTSLIRGSSIFELPKITNEISVAGKYEAVSFSAANRLVIGYSLQEGVSEDRVAALSQGTLHPPVSPVSAIEVRRGDWLTSALNALHGGRYGLRQPSLRCVEAVSLDNRPETIRLPNGVVVFLSAPKWSVPKSLDLRPEEEIFEATERWLARSKSAVALSGASGGMKPSEFLRLLADSAVSEDEKQDLAAVAGILSHRSDLIEILPDILGRNAAFREKIASFEEAEKARLRAELEDCLRLETSAEVARLASIRGEIAEAEAKLAAFTHRESLLRSETEKHDETLRLRIESAAGGIRDEAARQTTWLRDELGRLKEELAQFAAAPPPAVASLEEEASATPVPQPVVRFASDEQRQRTVRELSVATGLPAESIAAIIAACTEVVPVLISPTSATAAVDIAIALSGDDAAIFFCDPTRLSLTDVLNDTQSGLGAAIEKARLHPEILVAVALCGITSGPCEYWLPQLLEMRRVGRLPRNLALIASAGTDGMRVSVPDSIRRRLFPFEAKKTARPGSAKFEGHWPIVPTVEGDRLREAIDCLVDGGLQGAILETTARLLARAPSWMKVDDLKPVFLAQSNWLKAVDEAADHEHNKHFISLEG